jgi:hypothetical protein
MLPLSPQLNAPALWSSGRGVDCVPVPADHELVTQHDPLEPLRSHGRGTGTYRPHDLAHGEVDLLAGWERDRLLREVAPQRGEEGRDDRGLDGGGREARLTNGASAFMYLNTETRDSEDDSMSDHG